MMNENVAHPSAHETGSVDAWTNVWDEALHDPASALAYARGSPRTVKQLYHRWYFEDLWSAMGPSPERARYLELGAGRGNTSMFLRERGCDVTMLDLSDSAFDLARRSFAIVDLPAPKMIRADAEATGLPEGSFDCIFNIGLLEHFRDPRRVLAESLRLLSPGGLVFSVVVPLVSPLRALPGQALFTPWWIPWTIAKALRKAPQPSHEALRTEYGALEYVAWARQLGAVDVRCVPYNPYRECYASREWQRRLQVPIYRLAHALRRRRVGEPSMRCPRAIAQCELLTFRKPE